MLVVQLLVHFVLIIPHLFDQGIGLSFNFLNNLMLLLNTALVGAAGNVVNDIYDQEIDKINKPDRLIVGKYIQEKKAWRVYLAFVILSVLFVSVVSVRLNDVRIFIIPLLSNVLLYLYASYFKKKPFVGNFIVALLSMFTILLIVQVDFTALELLSQEFGNEIIIMNLGLMTFAFLLTIIREMVKDVEDIEGDRSFGCSTLPIVIGQQKTIYLTIVLTLFLVSGLWLSFFWLKSKDYYLAAIYYLTFVQFMVLVLGFKLFRAEKKSDYKKMSTWIKLTMVCGILGVLLLF